MEIGVSISPKTDLIEDLKNTSDKFEFVEIPIGELERPIEQIPVEEVREVLNEKDLGLIIHLPFGQPVVTQVEEFNKSEIKYLDQVLEKSGSLGAEKAVLHPNIRYRQDQEEIRELFTEQIKILDEKAEEKGIELCVENMPDQIHSAANNFQLAEILEDLEISMCFDTGHGYSSMGQEKIENFLEEYSHIITHLHLQDTRGDKDLHMPIKSGEIDFQKIKEKLDDFDETITLEVFCSDREYLEISQRKTQELFSGDPQ